MFLYHSKTLILYENKYWYVFKIVSQYCSSDKIEKNEKGRACSTYWGEERRIQGFGGDTLGKETTWETQV